MEKPHQNNRYHCYTKFTEKPRQPYRYVKTHPSTRFRKEINNAEKTNIEQNTNYQKTLAEYARRLEKIQKALIQLTNFKLVRKESKKEVEGKLKKLEMKHFWDFTRLVLDKNAEEKENQIDYIITRQIKLKLNLDKKRNKLTRKIIERCIRRI